ncbi:ATP phosphoribosyltransferase regulatory subunit [Methylocella tundrae]|uniref:ATP phosphoribosyltransferase regulatory subunit n=1 Tax=Methylocella tundrae TaxID=227605 RepID=A0A8B6M4Z1_METTU|nr:ATP phosphoribosyltransferase regulatory subunit [Methylocella tundrae]VTZ25381.1 ATP phosphoribosyltransferase regulatory subunit [Methylocella tundrae]VTZ49904.1 ATP phosphoribosyltransferase regulatory subunit [Methylocella tundrae]
MTSVQNSSGVVATHLIRAGYARCEPPILQPASIFFDSGEDLRGQLYLTSDLSGAEYCLRPEYTIPVSKHYLASGAAGETAAFSYCGPVFRYAAGQSCEFTQAGVESFGRADREAADAEILTLALDAASAGHGLDLSVRIGDAGLFSRLLAALDLAPQWRRRIARGHSQGKSVEAILNASQNGSGHDHSGVLGMLEGADKQGARAFVEDLLSIAGIVAVGGRTAGEIADRFLEQAALKRGVGVSDEKVAIIEAFFAIEGNPDAASVRMRRLAQEASLDLDASLDAFDTRLGFIAALGFDVAALSFEASFTRNLDYYTGFVFEALDRARPDEKPIVAGGRYDQLLQTLGADRAIPAVGASIWVDRLPLALEGDAA